MRKNRRGGYRGVGKNSAENDRTSTDASTSVEVVSRHDTFAGYAEFVVTRSREDRHHECLQCPTVGPASDLIPSADEVRRRLAANVTEAALLRSLLRLAKRREREAERLASMTCVPSCPPAN